MKGHRHPRKRRVIAIVAGGLSLLLSARISHGAELGGSAGYELVWEDAFDGTEIDPRNWEHEVIPGVASGNHELQRYTNRKANSFLRDGCLVIRALKERYQGHDYTSARIRTLHKQGFRFGRFEARLKVPTGKGLWPAFWMLPSEPIYGPWPFSGEIDILESINRADQVHGTIHYGTPAHVYHGDSFPRERGAPPRDFSAEFHVYAVQWEPTSIRWFVDGQEYGRHTQWSSAQDPFPAPFDQSFYLLLNLAIGGTWPGPPDENTSFPQELVVDWVRVYQIKNREPAIRIITPESGAHLDPGADVPILAEGSDPDGKVGRVLFYLGKEQVGELQQPPFQVLLKGIEEGCHKITVVALDDRGEIAKDIVNVTVGAGCSPHGPFRGAPLEVPGRLEAEWFDDGVEGEAFHDTDRYNRCSEFRGRTGVDVDRCREGGHCLSWLATGEWVKYTIDVKETGRYTVKARVASEMEGGEFHLEFGETPESISVRVPKTEGWQIYESVSAGEVHLNQGEQLLRLVTDRPAFNLSYIEIQKN